MTTEPSSVPMTLTYSKEFCEERGYTPGSAEAENTAFMIVTLFKCGIVDESSLRKALENSGKKTAG
jgi:hypothetical protein